MELDLSKLVAEFLALVGLAAFLAGVVNLLKLLGIVQDGSSATWSAALNLVGFVLFVALKIFSPDIDVLGLDGMLKTVAEVLVLLLSLFGQVFFSRLVHAHVLRGVWLVGKSFSK